jgi:hypothetical protein
LIAAELAMLERVPVARIATRRPDAAALAGAGLEHPSMILLLYSRDTAGPVARIELGNTVSDRPDRYARIQQRDTLVIVPDDASQHLATLLQLAGTPS